jgi:hypothetical protein
MIIVDTSVWIAFFNRPNSQERKEVDRFIDAEDIVMVGVVLTELLQGTRSSKERRLIKDALLALPYFETSQSTWILAGEISLNHLQRGITLSIPDLLIAAFAQQHDCRIYTLDTDFKRITGITLYTPSDS